MPPEKPGLECSPLFRAPIVAQAPKVIENHPHTVRLLALRQITRNDDEHASDGWECALLWIDDRHSSQEKEKVELQHKNKLQAHCLMLGCKEDDETCGSFLGP